MQATSTMVRVQRGECAICGTAPDHSLNVDHCHQTQQVRGLLCRACNLALGLFQDDCERMFRAIRYVIERSSVDNMGGA